MVKIAGKYKLLMNSKSIFQLIVSLIILKLNTSIAIFCKGVLALPTVKIQQALLLSIFT